MKKFHFLILSFFFANNVFSQNIEIGLNAGLGIYTGDIEIKAENYKRQKRSNVGAFVRVPLNSSFVVRAQVFHGQFFANEKKYPTTNYRATRGFSFNTTFTELSARLEWHFLKLDNQFYFEDEDPTMSLYSFCGFGAMFFKPQTNYNTANKVIDKTILDQDAKYATTAPVMALGMGAKYNVTSTLALGIEMSAQKPFTDYLDGISKVSDSKTKDYYFFAHLLISYNFGNASFGRGSGYMSNRGRRKSGCPTF